MTHQSELAKMESNFENKIKILDVKVAQFSLVNTELKEKKAALESAVMVEKKER
jgi:hypothetical protein